VERAARRRADVVERGVKVFRVDNPHTKADRFWSVIREVRGKAPETIFMAEAFTRAR